MINQDLKALGREYQVLPNLGICCGELRGLKVTSFRACVRSFYSVGISMYGNVLDMARHEHGDCYATFKKLVRNSEYSKSDNFKKLSVLAQIRSLL